MRNVIASMSNMVARMREMEIAANNLANTNTPGYKQNLYFDNVLQDVLNRNEPYFGGQLRLEEREIVDLDQGTLEQTDNPLDVAINGNDFFVIQTDQGELYTRNGNFQLDPNGTVITSTGSKVLGMGGPVTLDPEDGAVNISKNGTITQGENFIDQLRLVTPVDPLQITKMGDSEYQFRINGESDEQSDILQGFLEKSNVNSVESMVDMISLQRLFESNQRVLKTIDDIDRLATNDVGRI